MKNKASLPRNPVAKHMRQFNKPSVVPNKRREQVSSRSACLLDEHVSEGTELPVEMANELMFEDKTECLSHEEE